MKKNKKGNVSLLFLPFTLLLMFIGSISILRRLGEVLPRPSETLPEFNLDPLPEVDLPFPEVDLIDANVVEDDVVEKNVTLSTLVPGDIVRANSAGVLQVDPESLTVMQIKGRPVIHSPIPIQARNKIFTADEVYYYRPDFFYIIQYASHPRRHIITTLKFPTQNTLLVRERSYSVKNGGKHSDRETLYLRGGHNATATVSGHEPIRVLPQAGCLLVQEFPIITINSMQIFHIRQNCYPQTQKTPFATEFLQGRFSYFTRTLKPDAQKLELSSKAHLEVPVNSNNENYLTVRRERCKSTGNSGILPEVPGGCLIQTYRFEGEVVFFTLAPGDIISQPSTHGELQVHPESGTVISIDGRLITHASMEIEAAQNWFTAKELIRASQPPYDITIYPHTWYYRGQNAKKLTFPSIYTVHVTEFIYNYDQPTRTLELIYLRGGHGASTIATPSDKTKPQVFKPQKGCLFEQVPPSYNNSKIPFFSIKQNCNFGTNKRNLATEFRDGEFIPAMTT